MSAWRSLAAEVVATRYPSLVAYGVLLTANRPDSEDRTRLVPGEHAVPPGGPPRKSSGSRHTVVGTGTAIVNGGAPLPLDRFRGPSTTTVTFSESAWCPSSRPVATTIIAFEGVERVVTAAGTETQSTVFDFWSANVSDWLTLGGGN